LALHRRGSEVGHFHGVAAMTPDLSTVLAEPKTNRHAMDTAATQAAVIEVLQDMVKDWDLDQEIGANSRLVRDLQFESIDIIQLVVALEERFHRRNLGFSELLMTDGRYVDDLSVAQIVAFLASKISGS
jgi:acyl carrier protein